MSEARELVMLTKAERMLAAATKLDEVKHIRDTAEAARGYSRKIGLSQDITVHAHELLVFAIKGNAPFRHHSQRSWLEADRTSHSTKPEQIRGIIEKVSLGPYLEMYGRVLPQNSAWCVYGN